MTLASSQPSLLLLHDGELADVAALLRELGATPTERHGTPVAQDGEPSWRVVIASARRALELPMDVIRASTLRIAILDGDSRTVTALLRRASFELIVRRPVHPAALRLLLLHSLYRGPEKRRSRRVSVGAPVQVRAGLRKHPALLAEISERGCRLLSAQRVGVGQTLTLQVPAGLSGGRAFSVKGLVVRATPAQIGAPGVITLEFDPLRGPALERVRALVSAHSGGPSALQRGDALAETTLGAPRPARELSARQAPAAAAPSGPSAEPVVREAAPAPRPAPGAPPTAADESSEPALEFDLEGELEGELEFDLEDERADELGEAPCGADDGEPPALARRLVPLSAEAARVVLARGLSRDGMHADPSQRLALGSELCLALHVDSGGPPIHVRAHVEPAAAGEPDKGLWLRFAQLAPDAGERLDALLAGQAIFAGGDGPEHALVVCEIVESVPG